jgi:hypothetical protein
MEISQKIDITAGVLGIVPSRVEIRSAGVTV